MTLLRLEPFREIDTLQRQMNRLFDDMLAPIGVREGNGVHFVPSVELDERDEALDLKLEVPGIKPEDLDIEAKTDSIAIRGERKSETKTEERGLVRSEFRYGRFERILPLPCRIQNDAIKAEYRDGILHLTMPKVEEEKTKVVKVNVG